MKAAAAFDAEAKAHAPLSDAAAIAYDNAAWAYEEAVALDEGRAALAAAKQRDAANAALLERLIARLQ